MRESFNPLRTLKSGSPGVSPFVLMSACRREATCICHARRVDTPGVR